MKKLFAIATLVVACVVTSVTQAHEPTIDPPIYKDGYVIAKAKAENWPEAIGMSLYWSAFTDRRPGVLLITRPNKDDKQVLMAKLACARGHIKLVIVNVD